MPLDSKYFCNCEHVQFLREAMLEARECLDWAGSSKLEEAKRILDAALTEHEDVERGLSWVEEMRRKIL